MSKWYKFYVMEFTNKLRPTPAGNVFIKAGITHHMDVMKRFDPSVDDGYQKNYDDWKIVCKFSQVFQSKEEAESFEKLFLEEVFPYDYNKNKVWVEDVLGFDRYHYKNVSGISEIRMIPIQQAKQLYRELNESKKRAMPHVATSTY